MHTKRVQEINNNSPLKTDEKDPRVIADIVRLGHALSVVVPEGDAAYLRRLNHTKERDYVQLLYTPHRQGDEEDFGACCNSQETPTDHPCDREG